MWNRGREEERKGGDGGRKVLGGGIIYFNYVQFVFSYLDRMDILLFIEEELKRFCEFDIYRQILRFIENDFF